MVGKGIKDDDEITEKMTKTEIIEALIGLAVLLTISIIIGDFLWSKFVITVS